MKYSLSKNNLSDINDEGIGKRILNWLYNNILSSMSDFSSVGSSVQSLIMFFATAFFAYVGFNLLYSVVDFLFFILDL